MVVSFPVKVPKEAITANSLDAVDQLKFQELMQGYWSDNSVSATCYYTLEELPEIKKYLRDNFTSSIKSVSFCLHTKHGFKQAPFEYMTGIVQLKI
jgi:hypothetical protein